MSKHDQKRRVQVSRVRPREITEQERKIARALIALAHVQLAAEADDLADDVAEAEARAALARKQAVRQRRAERAERLRDEAERDQPDGGPA